MDALHRSTLYTALKERYAISRATPIRKGLSGDKKYRLDTADGQHMLLRVSDLAEHDAKKAAYDLQVRLADAGIATPRPISFGISAPDQIVFQLQEWVDGEDVHSALQHLPAARQYLLGVQAGELLRRIHALPAPEGLPAWSARYDDTMAPRMAAYRAEGVPFAGSDTVLAHLARGRSLLPARPQCFLHGDFHAENLMVDADGALYAIDWLDDGFAHAGDPWYDLKTFGENQNPYFSTGLVHGYFGSKKPPRAFWDTLTFYAVGAALMAVVWHKYHRPEGLAACLQCNERNARSLQAGQPPLLQWYLPAVHVQWCGGVPCLLKARFSLAFLREYGDIFEVFDTQRSGNLCFGMHKGGHRYFVKFAGAPTLHYDGAPEEMVALLRAAADTYRDLAHPSLIRLLAAEAVSGGYMLVFAWTDAVCAGRDDPASRAYFMALPTAVRMRVFEDILAFHRHAARRGYVAIDFYDASILYDVEKQETVICDIDLYQRAPYVGALGRWGSASFVSPEEVTPGAVMDELTTVHTMGQTVFALLTESDRSPEAWPLSPALYAVAQQAIRAERGERQPSLAALAAAWRAAKRVGTP